MLRGNCSREIKVYLKPARAVLTPKVIVSLSPTVKADRIGWDFIWRLQVLTCYFNWTANVHAPVDCPSSMVHAEQRKIKKYEGQKISLSCGHAPWTSEVIRGWRMCPPQKKILFCLNIAYRVFWFIQNLYAFTGICGEILLRFYRLWELYKTKVGRALLLTDLWTSQTFPRSVTDDVCHIHHITSSHGEKRRRPPKASLSEKH